MFLAFFHDTILYTLGRAQGRNKVMISQQFFEFLKESLAPPQSLTKCRLDGHVFIMKLATANGYMSLPVLQAFTKLVSHRLADDHFYPCFDELILLPGEIAIEFRLDFDSNTVRRIVEEIKCADSLAT